MSREISVYIELHAASAFSFLDGASLPEALVDRAAALGYPALALLDRDGVYGAPRFHLAAKRAGIKAIIGAELTVALDARSSQLVPRQARDALSSSKGAVRSSGNTQGGSSSSPRTPEPPSSRLFRLPVLVESREGYRNLCRLVTRMKLRAPKGEGALTLEELDGAVGGLIALVGRAAIHGARYGVGGLVNRLVGTFGASHLCVELQRHLLRDEEADNQALVDLAAAFHVPTVATNGVRFANPASRPLYDVLTCIRHKTTLERAGRRLTTNAERFLKPPDRMAALFADLPAALAATRDLADRLEYSMADLGYRFPEYPVPPGETMASFLRHITQAGARERYRPYHDRARRQVERELALIEKLDLAGYFLIVWDIVNYCRQHDILVQGRGSAANSAVCYSLGITAVDPVGMDLLFERFLSEERGEWPDIDLDLPSGDRREQVIQHLYDKYGRGVAAGSAPKMAPDGPKVGPEGPKIAPEGPKIAMTANVITYRGRSAAREVGKVLSLAPEEVDRLAKLMNRFEWTDPKETLDRNLRDAAIDFDHPTIRTFGALWQEIQDLPRHLGQHSGGMVICHGRLDDVVPLENATMPDRVVIQWDKDDCADMGLVKVDLLGLGMMSVLQDALELVNASAVSADRLPLAADRGPMTADRGPLAADGMEEVGQDSRSTPATGTQRAALSEQHSATSNERRATSDPRPPVSGQRPFDSRDRALAHDRPAASGERSAASPSTRMIETSLGTGGQRSADLDLAHLPPNDPVVYRMLQEADTIGIFQVESRAQMATLPRLQPEKFYDIVVEVAIIRPGPIVGQMVHPYLKRRQGLEPVTYPHPALEPILKRTLGVPLFQEQLLRMAMVAAGFSGGEAEELRRAFGFKRSEKRMQQIEGKLRDGMARQGITGETAETIIRSIASFALYGFPESHAASFALLVYASAYLKAHYPAAFFTAMLNNQPMGFYHPATLVKDAQRHGVRFAPIDVQVSDWECRVEPDGRVRLGLMYVNGLRQEIGRRIADRSPVLSERSITRVEGPLAVDRSPLAADRSRLAARCPKCGCDDASMLEETPAGGSFCNICAHETPAARASGERPFDSRDRALAQDRPAVSDQRFSSLEDLIKRTGLRRDELATLAEIGALNAFGYDRRSALWQIERAVRPSGELFDESLAAGRFPLSDQNQDTTTASERRPASGEPFDSGDQAPARDGRSAVSGQRPAVSGSPLRSMTDAERLMADYAGTSLTIGPHPLALRRAELALRGVLRASDLPRGRHGRRVRVAGAVITRQRPGTAKGFVFLTLEDETGIANVIVRPDLFTDERQAIIGEPYLLVEGTLQIQEGVTSIKAERVVGLTGGGPEPQSHDFR